MLYFFISTTIGLNFINCHERIKVKLLSMISYNYIYIYINKLIQYKYVLLVYVNVWLYVFIYKTQKMSKYTHTNSMHFQKKQK